MYGSKPRVGLPLEEHRNIARWATTHGEEVSKVGVWRKGHDGELRLRWRDWGCGGWCDHGDQKGGTDTPDEIAPFQSSEIPSDIRSPCNPMGRDFSLTPMSGDTHDSGVPACSDCGILRHRAEMARNAPLGADKRRAPLYGLRFRSVKTDGRHRRGNRRQVGVEGWVFLLSPE